MLTMLGQLSSCRTEFSFLPRRTAKRLAGLLLRVSAVYGYPNDDGSLEDHGPKFGSCEFRTLKVDPSGSFPVIEHCSIVQNGISG
jgi:hypothetical protein